MHTPHPPPRPAGLRLGGRLGAVALAAATFTLAGAGVASAHVTAQPNSAEKGSYAKIAFPVPSEKPTAGTVKLQVTLPTDHPVASVRTTPMPGWTAQITPVTLNPPVQEGKTTISQAPHVITWTAQQGTRLGPTEFADFEVSMGALPENADELVMPAVQTYDDGSVVNWDQVAAPGADEPEHPAPVLHLVAKSGNGHHDLAGAEHGSATSTSASDGDSGDSGGVDDTARWLGGVGLVLGALGLGLGAGAVARTRRSRR